MKIDGLLSCFVKIYTFAKLFLKAVDNLSGYKIAFKGLSDGRHKFEFNINDSFFACFEGSLIQSGELVAEVELVKQSMLMTLNMTVEGSVVLQCDRCLEDYSQPIKNESSLYVKIGGNPNEDMGDDMIIVPADDGTVDVSYYIYELVVFGLPIRHVHPEDESGNSGCDPEMMSRLNSLMIGNDSTDASDDEPVIDERWSKLKDLLDNK